MKRLRLYMLIFGVLVSLPLVFVAWRTYAALDREALAQVRFFAERLLDGVEGELAGLVAREEARAVDEYRRRMVPPQGGARLSPLADPPDEPFILGYLQNNPDGSFQTPLVDDPQTVPAALADRVAQLETANRQFNQRKRLAHPPAAVAEAPAKAVLPEKQEQAAFADRFLTSSPRKKEKSALGQERTRVEEITAGQAMNLARQSAEPSSPPAADAVAEGESDAAGSTGRSWRPAESAPDAPSAGQRQEGRKPTVDVDSGRFQVEVAPLQAVTLGEDRVFIFRRIGIDGQIYRQGVVIRLHPFLDHLLARHYDAQPIAQYTRLTLNAAGAAASREPAQAPPESGAAAPLAARAFPAPFGFLTAEMGLVSLPPSPARRTLTLALAVLGIVMVAGLTAIFHSTRAVLDLSERRSRFVSAVTHELKTPLTTIRMYVEMLDQGIAATPAREREYMAVLASESARLSGLINNVLELSRLEKQTRRFTLQEGDLSDVLADVRRLMADSLTREGFSLTVETERLPSFAYDREVLVQVLINLMENSIKFGRHLPDRRIALSTRAADGWVSLAVSDSGPGIPRRDLRRVFDDFYRVDDDLTRAVGGTGIGLALVKKFILAMGGRVRAANNAGPGCTITLSLPIRRPSSS